MAFQPSNTSRSPLALAVLVLLTGSLAACKSDRVDQTGSIYPHDVRVRHPFVLAEGTTKLDIFPSGPGHLDPRQAADLDAFLLEYRRYGRGSLAIDMPRGASSAATAAAERTGAAVRRAAAENGLPNGVIVVASYAAADPGLASPVRLSFQQMEAKVASACGLWPQDLGVSSPVSNLRNEPSWNLGCATRSNIAAQIADPVDLVRGRPEGRIDTVRRTQVIDKLRQGNDPSTKWNQDGKNEVKSNVSQ
ncbi:CpaD family pilus assembly lipoprotein [Methylobacterium sp. C25]|uniref:CpaD family pilus assembly protein n=1 Tax=Methylobacterium sp. C25 TaxID=2721622 RepID=UPI001F36DB93|nr:CpaD family pilus assembly protein [Methylobacterium sp. C25]MCE4225189.1 CpaD family pilus assembly lipoprotein [Methylobacterium sp. C25]